MIEIAPSMFISKEDLQKAIDEYMLRSVGSVGSVGPEHHFDIVKITDSNSVRSTKTNQE